METIWRFGDDELIRSETGRYYFIEYDDFDDYTQEGAYNVYDVTEAIKKIEIKAKEEDTEVEALLTGKDRQEVRAIVSPGTSESICLGCSAVSYEKIPNAIKMHEEGKQLEPADCPP